MEQLLKHMYAEHSFMIPFKQYLVDKTGMELIKELQKQVSVARTCLVCLKGFKSTERCQKHMTGAGHTVFDPETFVE